MNRAPEWRWSWILGLAANVAVAFGCLFYAFSVLLTDEAAGSVFSTTVLSVAYGGSVLIGGLLAFWIGRHADAHGIRGIVILGAFLGAAGLVGFGVSQEPWQVIAVSWILVGPAGGLLFYEPAFIAVDQWFGARYRARALSVLTVIGGLAGPIFIPVTGALVGAFEWRVASAVLGVITLVTAIGVAVVVLPTGGAAGDVEEAPRLKWRPDRRFVLFTAAMFLTYGGMQSVFFHRIAVFEEAGFALGTVTAWAAVSGIMSFPGRSSAAYLAQRVGAIGLHAGALVVQAVAVVLMVGVASTLRMGSHFILFGLMLGTILPLRAVIMGGWFSGPAYGRIMGAQWSTAAFAGAAGATLIGVLRDTVDSYDLPMLLIAIVFIGAAVLTLLSGRAARRVSSD